VPGAGYEVNAISYGHVLPLGPLTYFFSVSRGSVGLPGSAVAHEAAFSDQAADIYVSTGAGTNFQFRDGNGAIANPLTPGAPSPPLGLLEPTTLPGDNVDGLDLRVIGPMVYWSVDAATALVYGAGYTAADIFMAPAVPGYSAAPGVPYASAATLGLLAGDDIDAMVYFEDGIAGASPGDLILFSLAQGSPTLGLGFTAADILSTSPGAAAPVLHLSALQLGLLPGDDELDALDVIPEPASWLMLGTALFGCSLWRRRR